MNEAPKNETHLTRTGLFDFHRLNPKGIRKAKLIADLFDGLLQALEDNCGQGREFSIVRTKLEEACFFAKKSMAVLPENQEAPAEAGNE